MLHIIVNDNCKFGFFDFSSFWQYIKQKRNVVMSKAKLNKENSQVAKSLPVEKFLFQKGRNVKLIY